MHAAGEFSPAAHLEALLLQRASVLRPSCQHPDVGDTAQVSRVEAADDAAADDTDPLDAHEAAPTASRSDAWKCGITVDANSSWALIACQCSAPPALTVIEISVRPAQSS